jgi:hypothetical protein
MKKTMQLDFTNQIAHIEVGEVDGKKVITKTWGKDFGWTHADALQVMDMHASYIANLNAIGIETSVVVDEKVIPGPNNQFLVQSREEYFHCGDLLVNLMASRSRAEFLQTAEEQIVLTTNLLFSIPPLYKEQYDTDWLWLSVPVDLKPPNAVLSSGRLVLVDTFRPLFWDHGTTVLQAMPGPYKNKQKLPNDEIKTGDIRFQAGRLYGYFVAVATRWHIQQNGASATQDIDSFRHELSEIILNILTSVLAESDVVTQDLALVLIADVHEIATESIAVGSYEGPRYVQSLYESEDQTRSGET